MESAFGAQILNEHYGYVVDIKLVTVSEKIRKTSLDQANFLTTEKTIIPPGGDQNDVTSVIHVILCKF